MSRPNRHGERSGACSACGIGPRADREAPASARPPALRPAVATVHLKPGGFKTSPSKGEGPGSGPVMNRQRTVRPVERECGLPKVAAAGARLSATTGLPDAALIERPPSPRCARGEKTRGEDGPKRPRRAEGPTGIETRAGPGREDEGRLIHPARQASAETKEHTHVVAQTPPDRARSRALAPSPVAGPARQSEIGRLGEDEADEHDQAMREFNRKLVDFTTCTKPARLTAAAGRAAAPAASCSATTRRAAFCSNRSFRN